MNNRIYNLVFLLVLISYSSFSQTFISGGILSNTTWSTSGSPYIVTGNTVVFDGVDLTIDPGVTVKFDVGIGLEIRGRLIAVGTVNDSITFTSNLTSPTQSSWSGINIIGTTNPLGVGNQITMEYCKGMYAHFFVNLDQAFHGPYNFNHCYFANNFSVNHDGGMPITIFENCKFENNNIGLDWCQFDSRVSNSYFINNVDGLVGIAQVDSCYFSGNTGIALSPYGSTSGCTVINNNIGVSCYFNSVNDIFENNTITNNTIGVEILSYFNGSINFIGNTICNNSIYNVKLLHTNDADIPFNCWCSTDSSYIQSTIYDGYVNISYGLVNFMPLTSGCPTINVGINEISESVYQVPLIYPNPFTQFINFLYENNEQCKLIIFDVSGRKLIQTEFINSTTINTESFIKGIYLYQMQSNTGLYKQGKIIKY